jgi:hypothetical protein
MKTSIIAFFLINFSYAAVLDKRTSFSKEEIPLIEQIKLESGAIVLLDQMLAKRNDFTKGSNYYLRFACEPSKDGRKTICHLIDVDYSEKTSK